MTKELFILLYTYIITYEKRLEILHKYKSMLNTVNLVNILAIKEIQQ